MAEEKWLRVPRTPFGAAVMAVFIMLGAFAVGILRIASTIDDRSTRGLQANHDVGVCVLREMAKFNIRGRVTSEQLAQAQHSTLSIPVDLEPRIPVQDKRDPCTGLLTENHIDVGELMREIQGANGAATTTTTVVTDHVPSPSQLRRLRPGSTTTATTRRRSTTTAGSRPTSTSSPPPTAPPCTYPVAQLCGLVP